MTKIYATEKIVHRGITFFPGQAIECGEGEASTLIDSRKWTQNRGVAIKAKKDAIRREFQPGTRRTSGVMRTG